MEERNQTSSSPETKQESKQESVGDIIGTVHNLEQLKTKMKGPMVELEHIDFFSSYLESNSWIKSIAVVGFNQGMLPSFFINANGIGFMTEVFLRAREDIVVVAFDSLEYPYICTQAQYLSKQYRHRFILNGGITSKSIELFSGFLGNKTFDMIYIAGASYPRTASIPLLYMCVLIRR